MIHDLPPTEGQFRTISFNFVTDYVVYGENLNPSVGEAIQAGWCRSLWDCEFIYNLNGFGGVIDSYLDF